MTSFARIPHDAVPAIREAVRDRLLVIPAGPVDVAVLQARARRMQYCSIYCNTVNWPSRARTVKPG